MLWDSDVTPPVAALGVFHATSAHSFEDLRSSNGLFRTPSANPHLARGRGAGAVTPWLHFTLYKLERSDFIAQSSLRSSVSNAVDVAADKDLRRPSKIAQRSFYTSHGTTDLSFSLESVQ